MAGIPNSLQGSQGYWNPLLKYAMNFSASIHDVGKQQDNVIHDVDSTSSSHVYAILIPGIAIYLWAASL